MATMIKFLVAWVFGVFLLCTASVSFILWTSLPIEVKTTTSTTTTTTTTSTTTSTIATTTSPVPVESRLLVLVIAGGKEARYQKQRQVWSMIAKQSRSLGVDTYFVRMSPSIDQDIKVEQGDFGETYISSRGNESLVPGCLISTVRALEMIRSQKDLPGSSSKWLLRTNLSSFWAFGRFLKWIMDRNIIGFNNFYGGVVGNFGPSGTPFASGAGMFMTTDLVDTLVKHQSQLQMSILDDVAIGMLLRQHVAVVAEFPRCDQYVFPIERLDSLVNVSCGDEAFHFRVKSGNADQDMYVFEWLYSKLY